MLLDKIFGSVFGMVWLIVFLVAILALLVWILLKKEKENVLGMKQEAKSSSEIVEEKVVASEVVDNVSQQDNKIYEIIESGDGFFRVKKVDSGKVLRKFGTKEEAQNYVSEKENNNFVNMEEKKEVEQISKTYEIMSGEDGFFRVRKIGSDKTLRKFTTRKDADSFIKEKENVSWLILN